VGGCRGALGWAGGGIATRGGGGHDSWAARDAVELLEVPFVEVHLSNVDEREEWRRFSVLDGLTAERIVGEGPGGYRRALEFLVGGAS
jgi:3-dehydroquinate dehydratase-2